MTSTPIRRTAFVLAAATLLLLVAGPAGADVPEGWSDPDEVGVLSLLLVVGAIPVGLVVLIGLLVYLPAMARGETVRPGSDHADEWFGGPRSGAAELEAREAPTTGGGRGSW